MKHAQRTFILNPLWFYFFLMKGPKIFCLKVTDTALVVSLVVFVVLPSVNFCLYSNLNYGGVHIGGIIPEIYFTAFRVEALLGLVEVFTLVRAENSSVENS